MPIYFGMHRFTNLVARLIDAQAVLNGPPLPGRLLTFAVEHGCPGRGLRLPREELRYSSVVRGTLNQLRGRVKPALEAELRPLLAAASLPG